MTEVAQTVLAQVRLCTQQGWIWDHLPYSNTKCEKWTQHREVNLYFMQPFT